MSSGIPSRISSALKTIFYWILAAIVILIVIRLFAGFLPHNSLIDSEGNLISKSTSTEKKKDGKWFPTPGSATGTLLNSSGIVTKPIIFEYKDPTGGSSYQYSYGTTTYYATSSYEGYRQ
jgi:hypothetical protein